MEIVLAVVVGWLVGVVNVLLYIRGRMLERWHVTGQEVKRKDHWQPDGYAVQLRKGNERVTVFNVRFDRPSSPNPDTSFADQLAQARADANEKAEALNAHEQLTRATNRKHGTPGGLT